MKRRVIAALAALLLAAVGGVTLLAWVGAADQRAVADLQPATVLVVTKPLPEGSTGDQIAQAVEPRRLPGVAVAPGAATHLTELEGRVSTTALQPGEQLLLSRLVDPASLVVEEKPAFEIPKGYHQVSVPIEAHRAAGGTVVPGARVGVFVTNDNKTSLSLHKVLVTAVQGGAPAATPETTESEDAAESGDAAPAAEPTPAPAAPGSTLTVTFALRAADAQKVVYAAEYARIWLTAEPADAPDEPLPALTQKDLHS